MRELTWNDVGMDQIEIDGFNVHVYEIKDRILPSDIGKRVFLVNGKPYIESSKQRDHRIRLINGGMF